MMVERAFPHAVRVYAAETREQAIDRLRAAETDYLRQQAESLPDIAPTIHVEFAEDASDAILARAQAIGADVIAMATHGHGGVRHLLTGSVTERVIRAGVIPVLTLRPRTLLHEVGAE
jgi:nucleotide-binding universal stress UspA family protein